MARKIYFACQKLSKDGKRIEAFVWSCTIGSGNVAHLDFDVIMPCASKKQAYEIVIMWNEQWQAKAVIA